MSRVDKGTVPYGSLWNLMEPWQEPVTVSKYREAAGLVKRPQSDNRPWPQTDLGDRIGERHRPSSFATVSRPRRSVIAWE